MGYYTTQLKALINRNILLKKINKTQTLLEILLPILMVIITYLVNNENKTQIYKEIGPTDTKNVNTEFLQYINYMN